MSKLKKIGLIFVVVALVLLVGGGITVIAKNLLDKEKDYSSITEVVLSADNIQVYMDGNQKDIDKDQINNLIEQMMKDCRQMPAFGVALDNEVKTARNNGVWIELEYNQKQIYDEMPFDKLLIEVGQDYSGFNIMRHHDGEYEGRCYYVDLVNNNMSTLYDYIVEF